MPSKIEFKFNDGFFHQFGFYLDKNVKASKISEQFKLEGIWQIWFLGNE